VYNGNGSTKFGYNYGGGIKVKLTSMFLGRIDIRDYTNGKPDFGLSPSGMLHQLEVSAGIGIGF
jgi:opacity protein-like surface antigen